MLALKGKCAINLLMLMIEKVNKGIKSESNSDSNDVEEEELEVINGGSIGEELQ